ncbi:MAG: methyltransferase [Patescibacteria group bacterium]|nr:methyltransferase [Patescibacteria group bacterium]
MKPLDFTIQENLLGHQLIFKTTYGLFSYKKIDDGTKLLINSIKVENNDNILDLGCGYGPVGIALAKSNQKGKTYFVDRDFVAVEYTKKNCKINRLSNCEALLSDGFSHLKNVKFNIIASNLPSHFSNDMLRIIFKDAKKHLEKNGRLYVVTVSKLSKFIKRELEDIFGNYTNVNHNCMYTVSVAMK